jgi:hypothetical protein
MGLFGRKSAMNFRTRRGDGPGDAYTAPPSHRVTLSLAGVNTCAAMLARSRSARAVDVADVLAAMYLREWDRLSQYWEEQDHDQIEEFLRHICSISPQRWNNWIEHYDHERRESERIWPRLGRWRRTATDEIPLPPSAALAEVLKRAEEIAPFRDRRGEQQMPILTTECILLCIARNFGSVISRRLQETGLDTTRLELDVLFPKRAPLT